MDTSSGPEGTDSRPTDPADLRQQFAKFGEVQAKQSGIQDIHTGKFSSLDRALIDIRLAVSRSDHEITTVRDEFSGRFEHLENEVAGMSQDLVRLNDNVKVLDAKVDLLQTDVAELRDNVTVLEVKVDKLQDGITEILDRLPANAA
jgi:chromosome segregation ATPase